jgi:hypothetical protein
MDAKARFWIVVAVAVGMPLAFELCRSLEWVQDLSLGARASWEARFGSAADRERVVQETGRIMAQRAGDLESFQMGREWDEALANLRALERRDPRLADALMQVILENRAPSAAGDASAAVATLDAADD